MKLSFPPLTLVMVRDSDHINKGIKIQAIMTQFKSANSSNIALCWIRVTITMTCFALLQMYIPIWYPTSYQSRPNYYLA